MLSESGIIISNIYKGYRLIAVPAAASFLSLTASFVMYGSAAADATHTAPSWLSAWIMSLPFMALPSIIMLFTRDRGKFTAITFLCVVATMSAIAHAVYGKGGTAKVACAGQLICTVPYVISCMAWGVALHLAPLREKAEDSVTTKRYSSYKMDFLSERGKVELSITSDRLLYMESESNYLTVAYLDKGPKGREYMATKKIRSSLKSAEARFRRLPLAKANRSCIVNSERIDYAVKEGRGGTLKLHGCDTMLKISQQNINAFRRYTERERRRDA